MTTTTTCDEDLLAAILFKIQYRPENSVLILLVKDGLTNGVMRLDLPDKELVRTYVRESVARVLDKVDADTCAVVVTAPEFRESRHKALPTLAALYDLGLPAARAWWVGPETFCTYEDPTPRPNDLWMYGPLATEMRALGVVLYHSAEAVVADVQPSDTVNMTGTQLRQDGPALLSRFVADIEAGLAEPQDIPGLLMALRMNHNLRDAIIALVSGDLDMATRIATGGPTGGDPWSTPPDRDRSQAVKAHIAVLARRAPNGYRVAPLAMLAMIAWYESDAVRGRGLAEMAVALSPDYRLAQLTLAMLNTATPPTWVTR